MLYVQPPLPNTSVCLFTPYPVYVIAWTKPHCSLSGNSSIWCIYTYSQHLFLPFSSPVLINFSRWKKFPHKLSLLKIFCSWIWSLWWQETKMVLQSATSSVLPGSRYDSLVSNKIVILTNNVVSKFYQNVWKQFKFLSQSVRIYQPFHCLIAWLCMCEKFQHQSLVCSIWNLLNGSLLNQQYTV